MKFPEIWQKIVGQNAKLVVEWIYDVEYISIYNIENKFNFI